MRTAACLLAPIVSACALFVVPPASGAPGDVKAEFDLPCRYPAGLATDGQKLYVLDWREARIFELTPAAGAAGFASLQVRALEAPTLKPQGLTWGGGRLYVSDDHTGFVYAVDPATGASDNSFAAPGEQAAGLAWADGALFILERKSGKIYKVMPEDGTILKPFGMPDPGCASMTYDGRHLWVANRVKDELYLVDPDNGCVLGIVKSPGPYAAGLAWLDGYLWNADFQTRKLYEIVINDKPMYKTYDAREARVEFVWSLYNYGPGQVQNLTVNLALPEELPNQQLLSAPEFSQPLTKKAADRWGQPCALFDIGTLSAGRKTSVTYKLNARISAIRYLILPENTGTVEDIPADIRNQYTVDGSRLLIKSPFIQKTVKEIVGDEKNTYWMARKIYNYVIEHLTYEMAGGWDIPEVVLKRGLGSCSEYTYSFIALCRAAGIPARYQGSVVVRGDDASVDEAFHRWAEIYLPNYGWVPVDANRGDATLPADQARGFGELANRFLITTRDGGDSEYLHWGYNAYAHYGTTGYCKIEEENLALWEPLKPTGTATQPAGDSGRQP